MSKLLIISSHLSGGCFQYSNEIIRCLKVSADIYVPKKVGEPSVLSSIKTKKFLLWGYPTLLRYCSLIYLLVKLFILGKIGYYHSILLFGYAGWDYYIMKVWKLTGRPSFFVVHDGKMHIGEANVTQQSRLCYIMGNTTYLIFLSNYVRNCVKESFNIDKPYHIAPHGLINYGEIQAHKQKQIPTLLFLGRVTKYKGIDTLLSAMETVPENCYDKLIIAGKWDSDTNVPKTDEKIEIINKYLTNEEILRYLECSDIMIFPYNEATQSGVATLALNYNKPSIVTNVGAFKEQFSNESAVFIESSDSLRLRDAIVSLCYDLIKRNNMVEAIKKEKQLLKWENIAEDLESFVTTNIEI